jgi:hypothetical protein
MTSFKQNADGDLVIENNSWAAVTGVDEVILLLRQRLQTFYQEWFLDKRIGLTYYQDIFQKKINPVAIEAAIKTEILNTPNVIELISFNLDLDTGTRSLTVSTKMLIIDEVIDFSQTIGA